MRTGLSVPGRRPGAGLTPLPNEKFSLSSYFGGTKSVAYLYEELAKGK